MGWTITVTYDDGYSVRGKCRALYEILATIQEVTDTPESYGHGDIVSIHAE